MRGIDDALGLLEVRGMTAALAASDVMAKAAPVAVGPACRIGDGLVTIPLHGEIAAVREALAVGAAAGSVEGHVVASHAIGRPAAGLVEIFELDASPVRDGLKGVPST